MPRRVIASGPSCQECRRRKIKCDRSSPCAYCVRIRIRCTYPPTTASDSNTSESDLASRVRRLEAALQSRNWDSSRDREHAPRGPALSSEESLNRPQLSLERHTSFRFNPSRAPNSGLHHPGPVVILFLWQTYLDSVDPVLKIFHVPTLQRDVLRVIRGQEAADSETECIMFAIYYSAVVTMSTTDCRREFQEDKLALLKRYRMGVEQALSAANFLKSQDLRVLQAFVLYLVCGRRDENGPDVANLLGIAIGTGMRIGLHRDGAILNIPPFEVELRRRLWWQLCTLDVRTAEDNGTEPTILESNFDTEFPLNINDASLDPEMFDPPQCQPGHTEMIFSLIRFEGSHFARRVVFSGAFCRRNAYPVLSEREKCQATVDFKHRIEKQYLSHCDKGIPLDNLTMASIRLILAKLKLAVCRPHRGQKQTVQTYYQLNCREVLHHAQALREYEKGQRWLWLFQTYLEWDALAYLLLGLCITPPSNPESSMWGVVDEVYQYWKNDPDTYRDQRWSRIEELRSQALAMRNGIELSPTTVAGVLSPTSSETQNSDPTGQIPPPRDPEKPHKAPAVDSEAQIGSSGSPTTSAAPMSLIDTSTAPSPTHAPLDDTPSTYAELPAVGTACEWSAAAFEKYWDIVGAGQSSSVSWL